MSPWRCGYRAWLRVCEVFLESGMWLVNLRKLNYGNPDAAVVCPACHPLPVSPAYEMEMRVEAMRSYSIAYVPSFTKGSEEER
ncbi:hypothetical protein E2C01_043205 [Portunus trituberculatus]|uniref:Uncharacterized protein n=1 Tax=Portunus trituberculatus TaxID=210409 RepID=A0A5B7FV34_PORTR|nr:hypothetical protein [Portunus trituberculatus]